MDFLASSDMGPDLYAILGCSKLSSDEQLLVEYRTRVMACHPDKHPDDPEAEGKFKQLQEAKKVLLDPSMRTKYDRWLNSGVRIPFNKWCALNESGQTFHWVKTTVAQPMLEGTAESSAEGSQQQSANLKWESEQSPWLDQFRKYQI